MKTIARSALVLCATVCMAASAAAQTPVGALAIDERQGDQYGWALDYETAGTAGQRALSECGPGCSVVLTFERCAAYAADQVVGSTVYGWAESYDSASGARQRALAECGTRGSGCTVRVWGCNGPVVEEGLGLDRAARRQVQEGLQAAGFDPGGADGMFGLRTRSAIRSWQTSRGARATGYLDAASVASLRPSLAGQPTFREREPAGAALASAAAAPAAVSATQQQPSATAEQENLFWQSIANSTNPAEFEAYLSQFPNGVFRALAQVRLASLRAAANDPTAAGSRPVGGLGSPATGSRVSGDGGVSFGGAAGVDAPRRPGDVFRDCAECPEMVVLPGGRLALGRYEVTVGEYRPFVSATGGTGDDRWRDHDMFRQTDRHPVVYVSWDDARAYVSWLSRTTGMTYRLPTEAEWERAADGSPTGCGDRAGTCQVGTNGTNAAGLSDMVGNVWEWTSDCWEGDCGRREVRGGSWLSLAEALRPGARSGLTAGYRFVNGGFRVSSDLRSDGGASFGGAAGVDAQRRFGDVFRDCAECLEMVVLAGGRLALGRYEVTVGEYRAFVSATGGTGDDRWRDHDMFRQTDRHPVVYVSWDDARAYVSWLSRTTGVTYRLPTEAEWERAAAGSPTGCAVRAGTCQVGTNGTNAAGLSDMVGNVWEWTSDCWEGDCGRRVVRGGSWYTYAEHLRPGARGRDTAGYRFEGGGFRVSRTLD